MMIYTLDHRVETILKVVKHYLPDIYDIHIEDGDVWFRLGNSAKQDQFSKYEFIYKSDTRRALELLEYLPVGLYLTKG